MMLVDDDIPTDKEIQLWDLDFESDNDDDVEPYLGDKAVGLDIDDGMDKA